MKYIFIIFFMVGIVTSCFTPLNNDEMYTEMTTVLTNSYPNILFGKISGEGNKSPLFYLQQKLFLDLIHYKPQNFWKHSGIKDRIILRLPEIIEITFFICFMFNFFSTEFNTLIGSLSILFFITTPVILSHWAEARPYSLWVILTGIQFILFIKTIKNKSNLWKISITNILISLTCGLSFIQMGSVFLFLNKNKWRWVIPLLVIPAFFIVYYKPDSNMFDIRFLDTPLITVLKSTNPICFLMLLFSVMIKRRYFYIFFYIASTFIFTLAFLYFLFANQTGHNQFIVNRHVIDLSIISIIGCTYLIGIYSCRTTYS